MLNESFGNPYSVKTTFTEVKTFIQEILINKRKIAKLYNGKNKIFEHFGIER
jgi:ribonuclease G